MKTTARLLALAFISVALTSCLDLLNHLNPNYKAPEKEAEQTVTTADTTKAEKGLKNGHQVTHYANGKVKTEMNYVNGQRNGIGIMNYENGKPQLFIHYKDGKKHGIEEYYYEEGGLYRVTKFVEGDKDSTQVFYYKNGKLQAQVPYTKGRLCAGTKEFKDDGTPLSGAEIIVKTEDQVALSGKYFYELAMNRKFRKVKFYTIDKDEDKTCPRVMYPVPNEKGKIKYTLIVPPGQILMGDIHFLAEVESYQRIPHLISKRVPINITNRG